MDDKELFSYGIYLSSHELRIEEVSPSIINQNLWATKSKDDVFIQECGGVYNRVRLDSLDLRPLGLVLGGDHNISHTF
jgi:hypothetical protein